MKKRVLASGIGLLAAMTGGGIAVATIVTKREKDSNNEHIQSQQIIESTSDIQNAIHFSGNNGTGGYRIDAFNDITITAINATQGHLSNGDTLSFRIIPKQGFTLGNISPIITKVVSGLSVITNPFPSSFIPISSNGNANGNGGNIVQSQQIIESTRDIQNAIHFSGNNGSGNYRIDAFNDITITAINATQGHLWNGDTLSFRIIPKQGFTLGNISPIITKVVSGLSVITNPFPSSFIPISSNGNANGNGGNIVQSQQIIESTRDIQNAIHFSGNNGSGNYRIDAFNDITITAINATQGHLWNGDTLSFRIIPKQGFTLGNISPIITKVVSGLSVITNPFPSSFIPISSNGNANGNGGNIVQSQQIIESTRDIQNAIHFSGNNGSGNYRIDAFNDITITAINATQGHLWNGDTLSFRIIPKQGFTLGNISPIITKVVSGLSVITNQLPSSFIPGINQPPNQLPSSFIPGINQPPINTGLNQGNKNLDRSGKGVWTRLPNGYTIASNLNLPESGKTVKDIRLYETSLFKYYIMDNIYMYGIKVTDDMVEKIISIFEKNVNYGVSAHYVCTNNGYEWVDKPTVEFIRIPTTKTISFGGIYNTILTFGNSNTANRNSMISKEFTINSMSYLLAHEYGHHETIFMRIFGAKYVDFKKYLIDHGLSEFTKYFSKNHFIDSNLNWLTHSGLSPINTEYGTINTPAYVTDPYYVFSEMEFLTRMECLLETNYPKSFYLGGNSWIDGSSWTDGSIDVSSIYRHFNSSPISPKNIEILINAYKETIYHINNKSGYMPMYVETDKNRIPKGFNIKLSINTSYNRNLTNIERQNLIKVFGQIAFQWHNSNDVKNYLSNNNLLYIGAESHPAEFNFNHHFQNEKIDEVISGWSIIPENSNKSSGFIKLTSKNTANAFDNCLLKIDSWTPVY